MNKYTRYIQAPYVPQYTPAPVSEIGQVLKEQKGLRDQAILQDTTTQALIDSSAIGATPGEQEVLMGLIGPEYKQVQERVASGDYYGQDANLKAKQAGVRVASTIRQFQELQKQKSEDIDTFYSRNRNADPRLLSYTLTEYGLPEIIQKEDGSVGLSHTLSGIMLPDYVEPKEQEESLITIGAGAAPPVPVETFAEQVKFPRNLSDTYRRELSTVKAANRVMTSEQEEFLLERGFYRMGKDSSGNIIKVPNTYRLYEDPFATAEYRRLPSVQTPEVSRPKLFTELVSEIEDPNVKAITTSIMDLAIEFNPELAKPENDSQLQQVVQLGIKHYQDGAGQIENVVYERFEGDQYNDVRKEYINNGRIKSGMFIIPGKDPMSFAQLYDEYGKDMDKDEFLESITLDGVLQDQTGLYSLSGESLSGKIDTKKKGSIYVSIDMGNVDTVIQNLLPTLRKLVNPFDFTPVKVKRFMENKDGKVKEHDIEINKSLTFMLNGEVVSPAVKGAKPVYTYTATLDDGTIIEYDGYTKLYNELLNPQ